MAAGNEDTTAFRTDQGTLCYKMMPFGLKNAGAMYQRLMDEAFKGKIGRNLEFYMDDLRLTKWAIELGEHAIEYKPRPAIKGQVLADFITEVLQHKEEECLVKQQPPIPPEQGQIWLLFTHGGSSSEGSGAGLRLVNPKGHEFTYAIKLDFKSTNNEAEYEAFLAGLRIAKKLGVKHLEAQVDSMLIAGQINGTYEGKNDVMDSYLSQAKYLILQFSSCKVIHINKSENKSADALSKLASTNFEHFAKYIRIEILDRPSVPQTKF
ncbi:uncharacterized protein LOC143556335 [Bidens hawaiensis]|uniref:uncharacterized protein LOC143556335 n=1 Tax=Bidens hawaiensis TaxID=980011 RepID=UPI00404B50B5